MGRQAMAMQQRQLRATPTQRQQRQPMRCQQRQPMQPQRQQPMQLQCKATNMQPQRQATNMHNHQPSQAQLSKDLSASQELFHAMVLSMVHRNPLSVDDPNVLWSNVAAQDNFELLPATNSQ